MKVASAWAVPLSIALATFALYAYTRPPGVTLEDAGFFLLAAREAGVAHPPGYPLYVVLAHVFSWLPLGGLAARVVLFSAFCGAAACALLFAFARALGLGMLASALAAAAYGVSCVFWSQAIIPEVYTLNALLTFALFLCCRRAVQRDADGPLYAAAAIAGLGLANHWPLLVLAGPAAPALLWPARRRVVARAPLLALLLLAPPLALYGWMVWRSRQQGIVAFLGPIPDLRAAVGYVLRRVYTEQDVGGGRTLAAALRLAGFYARDGVHQFGVIGSALAAVGFAWQWRRLPREAAIALCWACFGVLAALVATQEFLGDFLSASVVRVYPIVAWGVLALWLGLGFEALAQRAPANAPVRALLAACAALLVVSIARAHWLENDRREDRWAQRYADAVLGALPPGAILFTSDDLDTGPIGFTHDGLGVRPDVDVYNDTGLVFPNRLAPIDTPEAERNEKLAEFVRGSGRPVFAIVDWKLPGLPSRPYGLFYEVTPGVQNGGVTTAAQAALEELAFGDPGVHPWSHFQQGRLIAAFANWVAVRLEHAGNPLDRARLLALRERLAERFMGRLALAAYALRRDPPDVVWRSLDELEQRLPEEREITAADRAALFHLRGMLYRREGREQEAGPEFERAVDALPKPRLNAMAIRELLEHYALVGQPERAAALERRLGIAP